MLAVMGSTMAMTASDGSARHRLAELTANSGVLARVADVQPNGQRDGEGDDQRDGGDDDLLRMRTGMPLGPTQCSGSVSHATVSLTMFMAGVHGLAAASSRIALMAGSSMV